MKRTILMAIVVTMVAFGVKAQDIKATAIPAAVKTAVAKKYPQATKIGWEKENGNYEANWGGQSGEDNSAQFTPAGAFVQMEKAMPVSALPKSVLPYVKDHYKGAKVKEAGKVTDALGKTTYEAEIKGKDLIFDENGNFLKESKD